MIPQGETLRQRPGDIVPRPERRGLNRVEAAAYIGVSPFLFDEMVHDRRMPKPKKIFRRLVYDRLQVDSAFDALTARQDEAETLGDDPFDQVSL